MAVLVQAPGRKPRQGGIKSVVKDFIDEPRLSRTQGGAVWEDSTCGFTQTTWADCEKPNGAADKVGDGVARFGLIGEPFARYKGVQCFIGGDNEGESFTDQATRALEQGEDRPLEVALWNWASATGAGIPTAGTATSVAAAIGVAEQYADKNYVGQPILLMSRQSAQMAAPFLERTADGELLTKQNTPVIASGFIDGDDVAIIGWTAVYLGPTVAQASDDRRDNTVLAIAERVYGIGVDCAFRFRVDVTTP